MYKRAQESSRLPPAAPPKPTSAHAVLAVRMPKVGISLQEERKRIVVLGREKYSDLVIAIDLDNLSLPVLFDTGTHFSNFSYGKCGFFCIAFDY